MKIVFVICLIFVTFIWNVHAMENDFYLMDTDKSDTIDTEEFKASVTKKFFFYDKNKDGYIDHNELNPHGDPDIAMEFELMDINKDKKVDIKEFTDAATKRFKFFDLNKNGQLEREEFFSPRAYPLLRIYF